MNTADTAPGVYTRERDLSQRIAETSSTIGVIVGEASQGKVGQRVLITSDTEFLNEFGTPDPQKHGWSAHQALAFLTQGNQLYFTRVAPEAVYGGCIIYWDGTYNRSKLLNEGLAEPEEYPFNSNELFLVYGANPGDWNKNFFVRVYPDPDTTEAYFFLEVWAAGEGTAVEKHRVHLDFIVNAQGRQVNIEEYINRNSRYIRIKQNTQATAFIENPSKRLINALDAGQNGNYPGVQLVGGLNGRRPTNSEIINAWNDLYYDKEVVEIRILMDGGYCVPAVQMAMDSIAKRRMDCFCIHSVPQDYQNFQRAIAYRRSELAIDSSYSALYAPWLLVRDRYTDSDLVMPPAGHIGAAFAYTDKNFSYYWAPAGMDRGRINVEGIDVKYDLGMRNALTQSQVNQIRLFPGEGIRIFSADTLQIMQSALTNIPVRRLMIGIETAIERALLYSVFDPNNTVLRSGIETRVSTFLQNFKDAQALYDFGVVCDDSNNPPETIAAGDLVVAIYVDPVLPIKRINLNAIINRTGVRVVASI